MKIDREQATAAVSLNLLAGLWLIVSFVFLGYSAYAFSIWNDIILGIAIAMLSGSQLFSLPQSGWLSWPIIGLGFWLLVAPYILGYPAEIPRWNDIALGTLVILLSTWSIVSTGG